MQEKRNVVQEALLQMKNVEEAIAENAKGILASTMKEEINQLVKESLSEQDEEEVTIDAEDDMDTDMEPEMEPEMGDMDLDADKEGVSDDDEMDLDLDVDMDTEEAPKDMRFASDEDILKVFKAMGEDDGIIVVKDGEDLHLTDNQSDTEYLVKLGESSDKKLTMEDQSIDDIMDALFSKESDADSDVDTDVDMDVEDEEVVYEIEFNESDMDEELDEEVEEELDEEFDEELDEEVEEELDEENWEESEMDESSHDLDEAYNPKKATKGVKPKGVGIGHGPKFSYKKSSGGFDEDMKEGPKKMGTGKAKFDYKKGENLGGKAKKVETKEGWGSKKHEFKRKTVDGVKKKSGDVDGHYKDFEKAETKEAARTFGMGSKEGRGLRKGITNNRNYVYDNGVKVESVNEEVTMLREKNEEYRKALNVFREKLNEVAIFNSNLAYATRLFTEHSTTKKEKINILRRFDNVESLKESKNLYKIIKDELNKVEVKPVMESVDSKINKTVSTGSSTTLIESKTYENPQFLRMKDLMSKIK